MGKPFKKIRTVLIVLLAIVSMGKASSVYAAEGDSWTGSDKAKHVGVSLTIGLFVSQQDQVFTKKTAFGVSMLPGLAKELVDAKPSYKDLAADAVGAYLGIWSGVSLGYQHGLSTAIYQRSF